jgi:hypothetical protein
MGQHFSQHFLHCHHVAACPGLRKEAAIAGPSAILHGYGVIVVIPFECGRYCLEKDPLRLLSIAFGFFYFADETGLHFSTSALILYAFADVTV